MLRAQEQVLCERINETAPKMELNPTLSFEAVTDIEEFLSISLPDDILALFAVEYFDLKDLIRLDEEAMKQGWMGSQRGGKRLLYISQEAGREELIAIPRTRLRSEAARVYVFQEENLQSGEVVHTLADWLTLERERSLGDIELTEEELERIDGAPFLGVLTPSLVELPRLSESTSARTQRRVQHTKFGVGTVTQEHADGTLTILFDEAGEKVLLARFVKDA